MTRQKSMPWRSVLLVLAAMAVWLAGCAHRVETIPHISTVIHAPVDVLWADQVKFVADNQTLHMVESTGETVLDPEGRGYISEAILRPRQSFTLSDGRHVSVTFTLAKITPQRIALKETTVRQPPNERKEIKVRTITVKPYAIAKAEGWLVSDPVAAIKAVLPKGWAVLEVKEHSFPFYRPEGDGKEIVVGDPGKQRPDAKGKPVFRVRIWIMPPNYRDGGDDPTGGKAQTWPPGLVATAKNARVYVWVGAYDWPTACDDLRHAIIKGANPTPVHEIPNPNEPSIQEALTKAWKQVQAIKHPLLKNASAVKPSFVDAGHGLVSAEIDFVVNAEWNPKGFRSTSGDPVPIDAKRPYLFIQVSLHGPSPPSQTGQPHVRGRGFRADDIDYSVLVTVASSDVALSKRVESILTHAFDPWQVYPNLVSPLMSPPTPPEATPPLPANLPPDSLNPPVSDVATMEEKNSWPYSAAYIGETPLPKGDAKWRAIHECELHGGTTANVVISIMPVKEYLDYFRVLVRGKLEDKTVTNSVAIHRFDLERDKIERNNDPAEEPTVATLTALLGHAIDDQLVTDFIAGHGLQKYYKFDSGAFHRPDGNRSFALWFEGNKIASIIISLNRIPEISTPYQGVLPYGVGASVSPADLRTRLGKPEADKVRKNGTGWLEYERDGVVTRFAFETKRLYEITLSQPAK